MAPEDVRDARLAALRSFQPLQLDDAVFGQYEGYQAEAGVPLGSKTATFASVVLRPACERWSGVPFILKAGKCLDEHKTEVRVQFKPVPTGAGDRQLCSASGAACAACPRNELVIRIQPRPSIYFKLAVKDPAAQPRRRPGAAALPVVTTELDLDYATAFGRGLRIHDAYETLLGDAVDGDESNFVRSDFIEHAWRLWDPLLAAAEAAGATPPVRYAQGSRGPPAADQLARREGYLPSRQAAGWRQSGL